MSFLKEFIQELDVSPERAVELATKCKSYFKDVSGDSLKISHLNACLEFADNDKEKSLIYFFIGGFENYLASNNVKVTVKEEKGVHKMLGLSKEESENLKTAINEAYILLNLIGEIDTKLYYQTMFDLADTPEELILVSMFITSKALKG